MSFRDNLEAFLAHTEHVRNLLARGEDGFQQEFMTLKNQSKRYKDEKTYPNKAGEYEINIRKNRYKDILPFDYTRVKLNEVEGVTGSDYINASYVKGYSGNDTYVASQGPLPQTVLDFWRMIWEMEATIIVMSCNEYEMGKHKCERYWVDDGETKEFNDISISLISQRRVNQDFLIRTMKVKKESCEERVINQFHYTAWPDHGVPNSVLPIIEMIQLIRDYQPHDDVPLVIHCSAGCGRTGTICVIDYVFNQLKQEAITADFNLFEIVRDMRQQRPAMVQTRDQYELVHRAVAAMFNKQLEEKFDDYSRVYENVHLKPQVDKARMPPSKASPTQQRKRNSDQHNYVNCNVQGQVDGDAVKAPSLPGKYRHSTEIANLDTKIYENIQDRIEGESVEDVSVPEPKFAGFSDKRQRSFRRTVDIFSQLETDITAVKEDVPTSPTSKSPPTLLKKPVPSAKPLLSIKPSTGGGKPPPGAKPGRSADRPVPKERKHMPAEARRKSGPPLEDTAALQKQALAKEQVQRSISMGLNDPADNKGPQRQPGGPNIVSDKKQFAISKGILNEALATGGRKTFKNERSKSMKRPPFSPPKPPPAGSSPPKPPPASAKPGKERRVRSHDYEPVALGEFPLMDKGASQKEDNSSSRPDMANRLPVHLTQVQKTNLKQFSDDDNNATGDSSATHGNFIRKKQPPAVNVDLRGGSSDVDTRSPKTLPRQPPLASEYAVANHEDVPGRLEQRLKEKEAGRGLNTGKAKVYASAYAEVDLQPLPNNVKDTPAGDKDHKLKVVIPGKDTPIKPSRGQVEASGAYEFVAPLGFPPPPVGGSKSAGKSTGSAEDDVFSGGGIMEEGNYGEYNDFLEGNKPGHSKPPPSGAAATDQPQYAETAGSRESTTAPCSSTSSAWSFTDDEFDEDPEDGPPALPERTQASYELDGSDNPDASKDPSDASTASNKFKALFKNKNLKDKLQMKTEGLKSRTKGFLSGIENAVRKPDTPGSPLNVPPSGPPPRPPVMANQAEIIEKTVRNLEKQPNEPFMYNNHDISFPNRVPKPKPARTPPSAWTERNAGVMSYVPL